LCFFGTCSIVVGIDFIVRVGHIKFKFKFKFKFILNYW